MMQSLSNRWLRATGRAASDSRWLLLQPGATCAPGADVPKV